MKDAQAELKEQEGRLSSKRLLHLEKRADRFRQLVSWMARKKVGAKQFASLNGATFAIAAELISRKTNRFCQRADDHFDSIEAYGQEPQLDDDWLNALTGEKDCFYFSTESLVEGLPTLPRPARAKKPKTDLDEDQMGQMVEEAVQSFEQAMAVSHVEKPQEWIELIKVALRRGGGEANFWLLQRSTGLSPGALFLGLLLGQNNWTTTQIDFDDIPEFYSSFSVKLIDRD